MRSARTVLTSTGTALLNNKAERQGGGDTLEERRRGTKGKNNGGRTRSSMRI